MVKKMNSQIHQNYEVMSKYKHLMDNYDLEYEKLKMLDPNQVLNDAYKQIKIIKY